MKRLLIVATVFLSGCVEVSRPVHQKPPETKPAVVEKKNESEEQEVVRFRVSIPYFYLKNVD